MPRCTLNDAFDEEVSVFKRELPSSRDYLACKTLKGHPYVILSLKSTNTNAVVMERCLDSGRM